MANKANLARMAIGDDVAFLDADGEWRCPSDHTLERMLNEESPAKRYHLAFGIFELACQELAKEQAATMGATIALTPREDLDIKHDGPDAIH